MAIKFCLIEISRLPTSQEGGATEEANNNIVTLLGRGEVSGVLYGGVSSNKSAGNTLNLGNINEPIEMNSISAGKVGYFNTYNFYLPNNMLRESFGIVKDLLVGNM